MGDKGGYEICRAISKDDEKVLEFMRRSFFRDEPLNASVGLLDDDGTCPELDQFCLETLAHGLSLLAVTPSGQIVGACLSASHEPGHQEEMEAEANSCPNPKFRKILKLLADVQRRADVFGKFPDVDKLMEIRIVAVDSAFRGKGIATALIKQAKDLASELEFTLIKVDCTSHYSALAVTKISAQCVFSMRYADYYSPDTGEPVFEPAPPHSGVKTFVVEVVPPNLRQQDPTSRIQNESFKKSETEALDR